MTSRAIASFVMALCIAVGAASASSIGVFFDTDGIDCDAQIPENSLFDIYIIAILGGDAAAAGMIGADYRVIGADPAWSTIVTPGPGSDASIGNPIAGGCVIAWPQCQTPADGMVLLHTINVFSPGLTSPRTLRVTYFPCAMPCFLCPLVILCDPGFPLLCVRGGEAFINRSVACTVAVEPATWTQGKGPYTN